MVDVAYSTAGATSVYRPSPLQRQFRDIHTLTQHFFHDEEIGEMAGRALLGIDDGSPSQV